MTAPLPSTLKLRPRTKRGKRLLAGVAFLIAAALASVSIFATGPSATPEIQTEKAWPVSVQEVTPQDIRPTFTVYGRVESSNVTHLRTDLVARVAGVHVREGDWVYQGQPLVTLADEELLLVLDERRALLTQLEAGLASILIEQEMLEQSTEHYGSMRQVALNKLERHQDLMAKRLISQNLLDEVTAQANQAHITYQSHMRALADFPNRLAAKQAAIDRARAQLKQAELDVGKTRIAAPFAGPILSVLVAPGDRSNIGAILADIADASAFEVRVQVPERYGSRLHDDLATKVRVTATTVDGITLELSRLSSQVKPGQSGLDAFFELEVASGAPGTALGRLLELTVVLPEEPEVIALPVQSIYENNRIYSVTDNRLRAISIERVGEVQQADGEYRVLVRSAEIGAGDKIITTQLPRAISGLLVDPA